MILLNKESVIKQFEAYNKEIVPVSNCQTRIGLGIIFSESMAKLWVKEIFGLDIIKILLNIHNGSFIYSLTYDLHIVIYKLISNNE